MSKHIESILEIAKKNNGVVTAEMVQESGIPNYYLSKLVENGVLEKLSRGLYSTEEAYVDEMYYLQVGYSNLIFSHLSALYIHNLTDRTPLKMTVTVPKDQNVSKLIKSGLAIVYRSNTSNHLLGVTEKRSPGGFLIKVYDKERTICDIVKARDKMDSQVFTNALKAYSKDREKDLTKLMEYAKKLKVEKLVRLYMEVLL